MNGPTVDRGKTPVEFRGVCLRLSATALMGKNGKERPGPLHLIQLSCSTSIRATMSSVFCVSHGELLSVELSRQ